MGLRFPGVLQRSEHQQYDALIMELSEYVRNPLDRAERGLEENGKIFTFEDALTKTKEPLIFHLCHNEQVNVFLRFMGIIWSDAESSPVFNTLQGIWNTAIRLSLILGFYGVYDIFSNVSTVSGDPKALVIVYAVAVFFQVLVLCISLNEIGKRLTAKVSTVSIYYIRNRLKLSWLVWIISMVLGVIPCIIAFIFTNLKGYLIFVFLEMGICCVLTATMYFMATDACVALKLVKELIVAEASQTLTYEHFASVRDDIADRQASSAWINSTIVFVALLDIFCVILGFLVTSELAVVAILSYIALFIKEIPFVLVVYWQVAQVNEHAARLLKDLSRSRDTTSQAKELERMRIYVIAQGSPIVLSLAGMKLRRIDLLWQFCGWCLPLVFSFIKAMIAIDAI